MILDLSRSPWKCISKVHFRVRDFDIHIWLTIRCLEISLLVCISRNVQKFMRMCQYTCTCMYIIHIHKCALLHTHAHTHTHTHTYIYRHTHSYTQTQSLDAGGDHIKLVPPGRGHQHRQAYTRSVRQRNSASGCCMVRQK